MTLQTITPPVYIGPKLFRDTTATTYTLDATGEYVAWIIQAPKTGTISRIHFFAGTVTADGDGLRCRIETVGAGDGNPSGTLVAASSEVTHVTTTANSWNRGTTGLAAAVTRGDFIAVKLTSPAAGTTFNGVIRSNFANYFGPSVNIGTQGVFPYVVNAIPTAAKVLPGGMCFALEYDDGSIPYIDCAVPASSVASTSFNTGSAADERGNLFQVPVPCRVVGIYHQAMPSVAGADFNLVLYDSGGSALATITNDGDINRSVGGSAQCDIRWLTSAVSLSANTDYRLVIKPTTANNISATQYVLDTSAGTTALREAGVGTTTWKLSTRADAGAWTDTNDTIACIGLIVDQLDDGAGGSGGLVVHPGMVGGMRG